MSAEGFKAVIESEVKHQIREAVDDAIMHISRPDMVRRVAAKIAGSYSMKREGNELVIRIPIDDK